MKLSFILLGIFLLFPPQIFAGQGLWEITSVDTMKYSRDESRNPATKNIIPIQVKAAADLGVSHIAISTPYDDEFIPFLKLWVGEARKNNLKVWFRGNFSGWEGWFEYPKLTSSDEHIKKTYRFISQNPELFEGGDLFIPAPEAEAGILGDPRQTRKFAEFNKFLLDSYQNCQNAFGKIAKDVNCGIWSLNTDVVREVVTKDTIQKLGGVISIDHYTKTPEKLITDVKALKQKFGAKVVLGEFGAPIPDINGKMTEVEQAHYLVDLFRKVYLEKDLVYGMNYWVLNGGSTSLINPDNTLRPAYFQIQKYFKPVTVSGEIKDQFGQKIKDVDIKTEDQLGETKTDTNGKYELTYPANPQKIKFSKEGLISLSQQIGTTSAQINLVMEPAKKDLWYNFRLWIHEHFK